ncbi:hypothetical protein [Novipirellula rosea]
MNVKTMPINIESAISQPALTRRQKRMPPTTATAARKAIEVMQKNVLR